MEIRPAKMLLYYAQAVDCFEGECKSRPTATNANGSAQRDKTFGTFPSECMAG
jgi:hypothetical protein